MKYVIVILKRLISVKVRVSEFLDDDSHLEWPLLVVVNKDTHLTLGKNAKFLLMEFIRLVRLVILNWL